MRRWGERAEMIKRKRERERKVGFKSGGASKVMRRNIGFQNVDFVVALRGGAHTGRQVG